MTALIALPDSYETTRDALQRVAVHVVARSVIQAGGRIDLRVAPGGFATPEFGDGVRVRVAGTNLIREVANAAYDSSQARHEIDGASLAELADVADVDLDADLYVGHDTPPLGDRDEIIHVDGDAAEALAGWYHAVAVALDHVASSSPADTGPTAVRLWPEHFDVAIDIEPVSGQRVNLGGSPGDGFHAAPYVYVGPWTDERPGDDAFWNAPFGAVLAYDDLVGHADPAERIAEFMSTGLAHFH